MQPVAVHITVETAINVEVSSSFRFHADVSNTTYPTCTWSVNGIAGGNSVFGTVTDEGLYTAPSAVPTPNLVTIKATATADTSKSSTATVIILTKSMIAKPHISIHRSPGNLDRTILAIFPTGRRFSLPARPLRRARPHLSAVGKE